MFDPFGDFAVAGYLRNVAAEQDLEIVKAAEHELFRAQLPAARDHLARRRHIEYADFLEVHRIIFGGLYPWAGKDRAEVLPDRALTLIGIDPGLLSETDPPNLGDSAGLRWSQGSAGPLGQRGARTGPVGKFEIQALEDEQPAFQGGATDLL